MPFKKATSQQLTLNVMLYGPTKSGKTLTGLMIAEGIANHIGKRVAMIDTEWESGGKDWYMKDSPGRRCHPKAFDIDSIETKSLATAITELRALDPEVHGVVLIDSWTHMWQAAIDAYDGKMLGTKQDRIPMNAWTNIKEPYNKQLLAWLISAPFHFIACARQKDLYDVADGEFDKTGIGPQCEKNTGYEFPVIIRMSAELDQKKHHKTHTAYVEGDRSGVLDGRMFPDPTFEMIAPLLPLLDKQQREREDEEERLARDAELLDAKAKKKLEESAKLRGEYFGKIAAAQNRTELDKLADEIRKKTRTLTTDHREELLVTFNTRSQELSTL